MTHCVRSVLTASVKILPEHRPTKHGNKSQDHPKIRNHTLLYLGVYYTRLENRFQLSKHIEVHSTLVTSKILYTDDVTLQIFMVVSLVGC